MPDLKEPAYFNASKIKNPAITDLKSYLQLFSKAKNEKIIGEASTSYLDSRVAKQIYAFNPKAKIIIMVREPIELLRSYHAGLKTKEIAKITDFIVDVLLNEYQATSVRRGGYNHLVQYGEPIKDVFMAFPKRQIKIIVYDDFKKDNQKIFSDILKFLEVEENFTPVFDKDYNKKYLNVKKWLKMILNENKKDKANPRAINLLKRKYKLEVQKLSKLLNRNLIKEWGYDNI